MLICSISHYVQQIKAGHLQECNKQLFEDQLRRVIVDAKERLQKEHRAITKRTQNTGERPVLDAQISSESISVGATSQQVISLLI